MSTIFGGVGEMARALNFHMARQNLISANIANVDTPGYTPKELVRPENQGKASFSLTLAATDSKHISPTGGGTAKEFRVLEEQNTIPGNDLNYVSMEQEMARLGANSIRFQAVGRIISQHMGMLRYAAQGGR